MRESLHRDLRRIRSEADEELEHRMLRIWRRYEDVDELVENASREEREVIDRYLKRHLDEVVDDCVENWKAYGWVYMRVFFEHEVYPHILSTDPAEEDARIVGHFDLLWDEYCVPGLWDDFVKELKLAPSYEEDPEAAANWRISEGLKKWFDSAREDCERVKAEVRARLRREEEEDAKLLEEELEEASHGLENVRKDTEAKTC